MSAVSLDDRSGRQYTTNAIAVLLALEVILIASRVIASIIFAVYDDAFIIFQHARNLASGLGFVYYPGERVLGVTSPAFGVLLSLFYLLRLPMPGLAVAMNILIDCIILWLVVRMLDRLGRRDAAIVFGLCFAASPILGRISVGALETELFLLGSLGAIVLHHAGRSTLAVMVATGSMFLRPEAVLLVLLLIGKSMLERASSGARLAFISLLVAVPPAISIYLYYGSLVPQSVVAKARFINSSFVQLVETFLLPEPFTAVVLPFAIWGGIRAVKEGGVLATVAVWSAAYTGSYLLARPVMYSWYGAPVHFGAILLAGSAAWQLKRHVAGRFHRYRITRGSFVWWGGAVVLAFWGGMLLALGPSPVTRFVLNPIREYSATHLSSGATIVATDIGAIGYYSKAHLLDTHGLVWPPALEFTHWPDILKVYPADYLFMYATRDVVRTLRDSPILRSYRPIARFSKSGSTDLTLDPGLYPDVRWTQDYILLERTQ